MRDQMKTQNELPGELMGRTHQGNETGDTAAKTKNKTVDIIVPCYNEEESLKLFYQETSKVTAQISGYDFRYIFIDDGSSDGTLEEMRRLCRKTAEPQKQNHYISFSRNFGKEAAMYAGMQASTGDYAVIMDADLQHPPQLLADMLHIIEETGCDSCAARRVERKGEPKLRKIFARCFYRLMNRFSDIEMVDGAVDFRLMSRRMVKAIVRMPETQRFTKGIFAWVGFHTEWIEFESSQRIAGESKWTAWGLLKYALAGFLDFAVSPLKFIGAFGGIVAVGSGIYFIIEVLKTILMGKDTPGYASTLCLILFFGGIIISMLGVIGEYIGRMYMETKNRPIYIEKESSMDKERS